MQRLRSKWVLDLLVCAAIVAYGVPPMLDRDVNGPHATVWGPLALPVLLAPIFIRRRHPFGAAAVFAGGCVVSGAPTFHQFRLVVVVPVAVLVAYALATRCGRQRALLGLLLVCTGLIFVGVTESVIHGLPGAGAMAAFSLPICVVVVAAGLIVSSRERVAEQLAVRSQQLRRQREATAALAVEIDRDRLAVDLDFAIRSRVLEVIEIACAEPCDAEASRRSFSRIEHLCRESLDQMRMLLGLLRAGDRTRSPRPTLAELDELLTHARAGGEMIDLRVEGDRRSLNAGVELAAYRTVQYALGAVCATKDEPAIVAVRYLGDRLELEVRGRDRADAAAAAALGAARERVVVLGGTFRADTPAPGARIVSAWFPSPQRA